MGPLINYCTQVYKAIPTYFYVYRQSSDQPKIFEGICSHLNQRKLGIRNWSIPACFMLKNELSWF